MKVERVWIPTVDGKAVIRYPETKAGCEEECSDWLSSGMKAGPAEALLVIGQPGDVRQRAEAAEAAMSQMLVAAMQCGNWRMSLAAELRDILTQALTAERALALAERDEKVKWAYNEAWLKAFVQDEAGANWWDDWQASNARKRLEECHE